MVRTRPKNGKQQTDEELQGMSRRRRTDKEGGNRDAKAERKEEKKAADERRLGTENRKKTAMLRNKGWAFISEVNSSNSFTLTILSIYFQWRRRQSRAPGGDWLARTLKKEIHVSILWGLQVL